MRGAGRIPCDRDEGEQTVWQGVKEVCVGKSRSRAFFTVSVSFWEGVMLFSLAC